MTERSFIQTILEQTLIHAKFTLKMQRSLQQSAVFVPVYMCVHYRKLFYNAAFLKKRKEKKKKNSQKNVPLKKQQT